VIDAETIFRLAQDNFEKFYEGHETRESKIALKAIDNFHGIFQDFLYRDIEMNKRNSNATE